MVKSIYFVESNTKSDDGKKGAQWSRAYESGSDALKRIMEDICDKNNDMKWEIDFTKTGGDFVHFTGKGMYMFRCGKDRKEPAVQDITLRHAFLQEEKKDEASKPTDYVIFNPDPEKDCVLDNDGNQRCLACEHHKNCMKYIDIIQERAKNGEYGEAGDLLIRMGKIASDLWRD